MILDMIPENLDELLAAYRGERLGRDIPLGKLLAEAPEPCLTQVLRSHGRRFSQVYGSSWERLAGYAREGKLELFSADYRTSRTLSEQALLSLAGETLGMRRPPLPETLAMRVASFEDAVLMTDKQRIYREAADPDVLDYLMGDPLRVNRFEGTATAIDAEEFPTVWTPSIDTDLFRLALKVVLAGSGIRRIERAAEIGYASAAIARHLADSVEIGNLLLADLNPAAAACAAGVMAGSSCEARIDYWTGDGMAALDDAASRGAGFDLVMCNPPYLPKPAFSDVASPLAAPTGEDTAVHFEGTELFTALISGAGSYLAPGGRLLVNVSSLAMDTLEEADARARASGLARRLVFAKEVPVKVYELLTDGEWQAHLARLGAEMTQEGAGEMPRSGMPQERRDGYLWQTLLFLEYAMPEADLPAPEGININYS